jgi:hypothetical protein
MYLLVNKGYASGLTRPPMETPRWQRHSLVISCQLCPCAAMWLRIADDSCTSDTRRRLRAEPLRAPRSSRPVTPSRSINNRRAANLRWTCVRVQPVWQLSDRCESPVCCRAHLLGEDASPAEAEQRRSSRGAAHVVLAKLQALSAGLCGHGS